LRKSTRNRTAAVADGNGQQSEIVSEGPSCRRSGMLLSARHHAARLLRSGLSVDGPSSPVPSAKRSFAVECVLCAHARLSVQRSLRAAILIAAQPHSLFCRRAGEIESSEQQQQHRSGFQLHADRQRFDVKLDATRADCSPHYEARSLFWNSLPLPIFLV